MRILRSFSILKYVLSKFLRVHQITQWLLLHQLTKQLSLLLCFSIYFSPFVIFYIVAIIWKLLHCHTSKVTTFIFLKTCKFLKKNRTYIFQLMNRGPLAPCYSSWIFYSKLLQRNRHFRIFRKGRITVECLCCIHIPYCF